MNDFQNVPALSTETFEALLLAVEDSIINEKAKAKPNKEVIGHLENLYGLARDEYGHVWND